MEHLANFSLESQITSSSQNTAFMILVIMGERSGSGRPSIDEDLEAISELMSASEFSDLSVVKTGFAIHLMEPQLSKAQGLEVALKRMGIEAHEVLAIGDAPNDISMVEYVGHSVAAGG